jgi:hypothetical protein
VAYSQYTLGSLSDQLGVLLDDERGLYWSTSEKYYAIWEALRVWGALTSYWRARGSITANPELTWADLTFPWSSANFPWNSSPLHTWYDLSAVLPTLRTRTWTLNQLTQEIQFACLEAANGISGAGMSGQISIASVLRSIQRARNQFVIDSRFPYIVSYLPQTPPPPQGTLVLPNTIVYTHRLAWRDQWNGEWTNLWRTDEWATDHADPDWTLKPGSPLQYSESELAPLTVQFSPAPQNPGVLEVVSVNSLQIDLDNPNALFQVPDEWIHAIKYAALQDIFSAESQNKDTLRAQYCQMRYEQAMDFAKNARSLIRLMLNGVPLPIDSMAAIDSGIPFWRNQAARPYLAGALYDMFALAPVPDRAYGLTADVVQSAPIPLAATDPIPLGPEDIPHIIDYVTHILTFKCGGKEFQDSFAQYDSFLSAVEGRVGIDKVKLRYLSPLLGQAQKETAERPDKMEKVNA